MQCTKLPICWHPISIWSLYVAILQAPFFFEAVFALSENFCVMALCTEETFRYIVRHRDAKIYSQQQYPFDIIHFDPFKSRKENISFMDTL